MKLQINKDIDLRLFDRELSTVFFRAIHAKKDGDTYRDHLQKKYSSLEAVENKITDAIENKYKVDGTPDFFIFFKEQLAGVFEFHPLSAADHVEVGFWLFAEFRRQGLLSSLFPQIIDFARAHFDKSKLRATTSVFNTPSQGLLEKVGFKKTGRILSFQNNGDEEQKEYEYILVL